VTRSAPAWLTLAGLLLAALVVLYGIRPVAGWDVWWHLRAGQEAVESCSSLPVDTFSHTRAGVPWAHKDLGAEVLLRAVHAPGGFPGLVALRLLLFLGALGLVVGTARRAGAAPAAALLLGAVVVLAVEFRFVPRPSLFSLVLLPALMALRQRQRLRPLPAWQWAVVVGLLFAVWANLHRGALLGLTVLGVDAAAGLLRRDRRAGALLAGLAGVAGVLCTPAGPGILGRTVGVVSEAAYRTHISEWTVPTPALLATEIPRLLAADVLVAVGVLGGWWVGRRRGGGGVELSDVGVFLVLAAAGSAGVRFLVYLPLALAATGALGWTTLLAGRGLRVPVGRLAALGVGLLLAVALSTYPYPLGWGLQARRYPARALALARAEGVSGSVYNPLIFGGYLIWHRVPVFVDGRTDQIYPVEHVLRTLRARHDPAELRALTGEHGVEWLLLNNQVGASGYAYLAGSADWVPVIWTDVAVVYVRRAGVNGEVAARLGYGLLAPADPFGSLRRALARAASTPALLPVLEREVAQAVAQDSGSARAVAQQALFRHAAGRPGLAESLAELWRLAPGRESTLGVFRMVGAATPE